LDLILILLLFTSSIFFGIQKKIELLFQNFGQSKNATISTMSSLPILPVNIVNRILRDAAILHGEKSIPKFKFSKAAQQYIYRAKFRKRYLRKFANIERLLRFKVNNPPEFTLILPTTWTTPFRERFNIFRDWEQTPEEREATVSRMRPAMVVKFPQKTHTYSSGSEMEYKYSYCTFDNGCVFVEKNTIPDDDDYYLFFWRGYICLDGHTFPIFDMPRSLNNSQETPEQNPHGIDNCTEIKYLEKELGQNVRIPNYSQTNYTVYDEEKKEWLRSQEYYFTPQEARFLVPFYEEPEPDYGYYSD
jgi:hypothetical protein